MAIVIIIKYKLLEYTTIIENFENIAFGQDVF